MFAKMRVLQAVFGLLFVGLVTGQIDIEPRQAVRRIGDDVTVLCKVAYKIDSCRMTVGGTSYILKPNERDGDVIYSGNGLESGECGAHIKNIQEEWNGNVTCVLPPRTGNIELKAIMKLIVARAPRDPLLLSPEQPIFRAGETFTAQCVVPDARPFAKITWMLDDQELLTGPHQPVVSTEPGTDLQTISQNITRILSADDNGRRLSCRAEHAALPQPRLVARQLIVHYPPERLEPGPITVFGLKLGSPGLLNVTVRAHPAPRATWRLAGEVLQGRGGVQVLEPQPIGKGFYNCSLLISQVEKEDVDRVYSLTVSNDLGEEDFTVKLSTLDEPAGMELSAGGIVGIVLAVLILLIATSLVVFAKATDRWCFAGGRRRDAKGSESSDTESAVGGKPERSRLAELSARVRAVLPKSKDKVQATEAPPADSEEKPLSEEKKNVVYAELALGEGGRDKPTAPSTEYAEIVYTNQPDNPSQPAPAENKES